MLMLLDAVKLLAEIALLALFGQWILGILAGAQRERNLIYQLFQVVTRPLVLGARLISPRVVIDRHLPLVAFLVLSFVWIFVTIGKIRHCIEIGVHLCK